jgi:hypothetical protein
MDKAWAGVDAGKEFHRAHVLDASGKELLSRKVQNDEDDLLKLIDEALFLAEEVIWAVDQPGGGAALLLALLWERNQRVLYVPGLSVDRARDAYRGESKTDARDARVIADQARMRSDLGELRAGEQEIAELQLFLARRRDLVTDQSRTITRLREALVSLFPALERALDVNGKGLLILLTHYQSPTQLRRAGHKRIATYLRNRGVKGSNNVAHKALGAARSQNVTLPAQEVGATIVAELAEDVLGLKDRLQSIDEEIGQRFFTRREARVLISLSPRLVTPASGLATTEGCEEGTRSSSGSSTSRRSPAYAVPRSPGSSTTAREPKARGILRLSSLWRVGGSTYCGRCCVTEPPSRPALRLDIFIEILLRTSVNKVSSLHFLDKKFIGNSSSVCNNELTRVYLRAATVA